MDPCDEDPGPECDQGFILTVAFSGAGALPLVGVSSKVAGRYITRRGGPGINGEGGIAINLNTGAAALYGQAGTALGAGAAVGLEATLTYGSIASVVGEGVELEVGGPVSFNGVVDLASGSNDFMEAIRLGVGLNLNMGLYSGANFTQASGFSTEANQPSVCSTMSGRTGMAIGLAPSC